MSHVVSEYSLFGNVYATNGSRSGARATGRPAEPTPPIPYQESSWPRGFDQVTPIGLQQAVRIGQLLQGIYIQSRRFIDPVYQQKQVRSLFKRLCKTNPIQLYVRSSDLDYSIQTAQAVLAGMYAGQPPNRGDSTNPQHATTAVARGALAKHCKSVYQIIHELVGVLDDLETSGAQVSKLLGGTLLNEIMTHMMAAVNASTPVEEQPRKMYMYSSVCFLNRPRLTAALIVAHEHVGRLGACAGRASTGTTAASTTGHSDHDRSATRYQQHVYGGDELVVGHDDRTTSGIAVVQHWQRQLTLRTEYIYQRLQESHL
ncbi:unnamed protein product [Sphagnum balticum]